MRPDALEALEAKCRQSTDIKIIQFPLHVMADQLNADVYLRGLPQYARQYGGLNTPWKARDLCHKLRDNKIVVLPWQVTTGFCDGTEHVWLKLETQLGDETVTVILDARPLDTWHAGPAILPLNERVARRYLSKYREAVVPALPHIDLGNFTAEQTPKLLEHH